MARKGYGVVKSVSGVASRAAGAVRSFARVTAEKLERLLGRGPERLRELERGRERVRLRGPGLERELKRLRQPGRAHKAQASVGAGAAA